MKYLLIILGLSLSVQLHARIDSVKVLNKARDLQQEIERLEDKKPAAGALAVMSGGVAAACVIPVSQGFNLYDNSIDRFLTAAGIMGATGVISLVQGIRYLSFSSTLSMKRKELDRLMTDYKLYVDSKGIIRYPT